MFVTLQCIPLNANSDAREGNLREMIRRFQSGPDAGRSHWQWNEIEQEIFVEVEYED
jgi:hypothetical protein